MSENSYKPEVCTRATSDVYNGQGLRMRLWPAVVIVVLHLLVSYGFDRFGTTNIQNAIALGGVPLVAALLLTGWWLGASRIPLRDRFLGFVLFLGALCAVLFSQSTVAMGGMLLARALPAMTYGVVVVLVLTYPLQWSLRRWALVVMLVACACLFCVMRVDSIGGDLAPVVSWRWTLTDAERSQALPQVDIQETAHLPETVGSADWPAFRGPARDGRLSGVTFSSDWRVPLDEVWRRDIGSGWSSFIVVGAYLFTQEQRGGEELVTCYRADTGAPVWANSVHAQFDDAMGIGPRATPTYADGKLYTQGITGLLQCLDAATGTTIWKRDLTEDGETRVPEFGFVASPLVVNTCVIAFSGGARGKSVLAYHRDTGDLVWSAGQGASGYSSPHYAVIDDTPQVLMVSNFGIEAFAAETGHVLWEHPWSIKTNPRCVQPVIIEGTSVMFGATGTSGTRRLRVTRDNDEWKVEELWTTRQFRPYFNDGVLHDGYYYGYDGERVGCFDITTGERLWWSSERYSGQLLLVADMDALLILSESGDLALVEATTAGYNEMARVTALTGKTWNHPVISDGRLYIRNAREAVCYALPPQ